MNNVELLLFIRNGISPNKIRSGITTLVTNKYLASIGYDDISKRYEVLRSNNGGVRNDLYINMKSPLINFLQHQ